MQNILHIYPNTRAIGRLYMGIDSILLPDAISISSFYESALVVDGRAALPNEVKKLVLLGIIDEVRFAKDTRQLKEDSKDLGTKGAKVSQTPPHGLASLVYEDSFLGYLHASSFIFDFFSELDAALVHDFNLLRSYDVSSIYDAELDVLERIARLYAKRLDAMGAYDGYSRGYSLFLPYIMSYDAIHYHIDGIASAFEMGLFREIALHLPLYIYMQIDRYNLGLCSRMCEGLGVEGSLHAGASYRIALSECCLEIEDGVGGYIDANRDANRDISKAQGHRAPRQSAPLIYSFSSTFNEIGLVLEIISSWHERILAGSLDENDVALLLPDKGFLDYLKPLDKGLLNYALSEDVEDRETFYALSSYLRANARYIDAPRDTPALCEILASLFKGFCARHEGMPNLSVLVDATADILYRFTKYLRIDETRLDAQGLGGIDPRHLGLEELIELYLSELKRCQIEREHGGKVKVIELLESRCMDFKEVLIIDFNDGVVPSLKNSDIFLNSFIREHCGLPTQADKLALYKHYYYQLLHGPDKVYIAYVKNDEQSPSMLLHELGYDDAIEGDLLFPLFDTDRSFIPSIPPFARYKAGFGRALAEKGVESKIHSAPKAGKSIESRIDSVKSLSEGVERKADSTSQASLEADKGIQSKSDLAPKLDQPTETPKIGSIERLSPSTFSKLFPCMARYYYAYIEEIKEKSEDVSAIVVGNLVHKGFESFFDTLGRGAFIDHSEYDALASEARGLLFGIVGILEALKAALKVPKRPRSASRGLASKTDGTSDKISDKADKTGKKSEKKSHDKAPTRLDATALRLVEYINASAHKDFTIEVDDIDLDVLALLVERTLALSLGANEADTKDTKDAKGADTNTKGADINGAHKGRSQAEIKEELAFTLYINLARLDADALALIIYRLLGIIAGFDFTLLFTLGKAGALREGFYNLGSELAISLSDDSYILSLLDNAKGEGVNRADENRVETGKKDTKPPLLITGTIDRVAEGIDGGYHIIDYKTGRFNKENKKDYLAQLMLYGIMLARAWRLEIDEISLHLVYLGSSEVLSAPLASLLSDKNTASKELAMLGLLASETSLPFPRMLGHSVSACKKAFCPYTYICNLGC